MMDALTVYRWLGLQPGAKPDEIKAAYRRLAKQYHPDLNLDKDADAQMKRINEAYELLSRQPAEAPAVVIIPDTITFFWEFVRAVVTDPTMKKLIDDLAGSTAAPERRPDSWI